MPSSKQTSTHRRAQKLSAAEANRRQRELARAHLLARDLGLLPHNRALYEDVLEEVIGQRSLATASPRERRRVIDHFEKALRSLGPAAAPKPNHGSDGPSPPLAVAGGRAGDGTEHATQNQLAFIRQMERELGWTDDPARLQGFIRRQAGAAGGDVHYLPQTMPRWLATRVITGLSVMTGRKPNQRSHAKPGSTNQD